MTRRLLLVALTAAAATWPAAAVAQGTPPGDTTRVLAPITVTVNRDARRLADVAAAVAVVDSPAIARARPTWGLDEALTTVPGVYAANRYNFSLDQRISIRGFGARSSFGIRGIKVLIDGIPQSLPDGTGQLTNLELGSASRLEVLRGSSSALFGNASGGVISIATDPAPVTGIAQELRFMAGSFSRHDIPLFESGGQTWTKWLSSTQLRVGQGQASVIVSHLDYAGQRQHSAADLRRFNARYSTPLGRGYSLTLAAEVGDDPRADNPGALTAAELAANPDSAAAINLAREAGKDVTQFQGGATLRRHFDSGGDAALTVFGFARDLNNPQTFAYITIDRRVLGIRATRSLPARILGVNQRLTAGLDLQHQRDDRLNYGNNAGVPDTVRQLDQLEQVLEIGPFVQTAIPLDPRTSLTFGLRFDRVSFTADDRLVTASNPDDSGERIMQAFSGSLGLTRDLGNGASLYVSAGTSFETPTTTELTNRPDTAGGFNSSLEPQRAINVELGARGTLGRRVSWSAALFRAHVKDALIGYQVADSVFPGRVFFQNSGRTRHQGVELGADVEIAGPLKAVVAYTWSDFRYTDYDAFGRTLDGQRIPGIPEHWLKTVFQLKPAQRSGPWAEVQLSYSSSVLVSDTLATRAGSWWLTDARAGWDGTALGLRLSPFVALSNVFDRKYVSSVVINAANGRYYEPAPGRHGYVGLGVGLGR